MGGTGQRSKQRGCARGARGFTIVELLTVISILALLMAILIPSLSAARSSARANVCLSHLKDIGNLLAIYLDENDSRFPPVRLERPSAAAAPDRIYINSHGRAGPRWQWFLQEDVEPVIAPGPFSDHLTSLGFFYDGSPGLSAGGAMQMTGDLFTCPMLDDDLVARHIRDGAYGYNYQYLGNTYDEHTPGQWDNFAVGRHVIRHPGKTVAIADSRGAGLTHGAHSYTLDPPRLATEVRAMKFGPRTSVLDPQSFTGYDLGGLDPAIYGYSPVAPRHKDKGNAVFADMHAEAMSLEQFGYQVADGSDPNLSKGTPIPIPDPSAGPYTATNRLFNGEAADPIADAHRP